MRKIFVLFLIISIFTSLKAQVRNVNPDPNGEPWIIGGWKELTKAEISQIPVLKIPENAQVKDLPASLDNSTLQYFRPVFSQTDGCCAQASGVAYNFTYEINRARNTAANTSANQFPTHYTYNFLNGGDGGNGSNYVEGWAIIAANGCPTVAEYGGLAQDATYWMSGYDSYTAAMPYRVTNLFRIFVGNEQGLNELKYWFYNHGDGSATGGVVNFSAGIYVGDFNMTYDNIITSWGTPVNHAMTFVGWDDNIGYDFNNDGQITNNIDITGDGVVDMKDWERGALIMVNSWGTSWGDNGKAYVPYRLLALPSSEGGIGSGNYVYSINVNPAFQKEIYMKVRLSHNCRNKIKISAGVATTANATEPEHTLDFPLFNYQGGCYDMQGNSTTAPIEVSLDISPLLSYVSPNQQARYFLIVDEGDPDASADGYIESFSVVDGQNTEYSCTSTNVEINNNSRTLLWVDATINYDEQQITTTELPQGTLNEAYSTTLEAENGVTPYTWFIKTPVTETDISDNFPDITSNQITLSDNDDGYGMQVIDFDFPYFGKEYDTVYILSDGSLRFEPGFDYIRSNEAIEIHKVISPFASDLMIYDGTGQGIFYEGDATHATFRWKTALYGDENASVDVATTIYPDGTIKFFYNSGITQGLTWASGISAGDGFNYYTTSYSGDYDPSGIAVNLEPASYPAGMTLDSDGEFYGTPKQQGEWNLIFGVKDARNIIKEKDLTFSVAQGTSKIEASSDLIKIMPNPANDFITVQSADIIEKIEITDLTGQIYKRIVANSYKTIINVTGLKSGIYAVRVTGKNKTWVKKLVIVK